MKKRKQRTWHRYFSAVAAIISARQGLILVSQAEPNPWAEKAREELAKQIDIPRSRLSFSIAEDHTVGFAEFVANEESPSPTRERVGSARDWRPDDDYHNRLTSFQQEIGLMQPQLSSQLSGLNRSESPEAPLAAGEASDNSLSGENGLLDDLPEYFESPPQDDSEDPEAVRERILQKRTIAGVVSTYKNKNELQSALERRAALKFIQQKRADVDSRLRDLKAVEERRDEIQEHLDEIDSRVQELQAESERLFQEDQFSHRDRCVRSRAAPHRIRPGFGGVPTTPGIPSFDRPAAARVRARARVMATCADARTRAQQCRGGT